MLMSHAGIGKKQTSFGNDLLKIIPFLPFSILFLCDLNENTEQKSREIGKNIFFSLITANVGIFIQYYFIIFIIVTVLLSIFL